MIRPYAETALLDAQQTAEAIALQLAQMQAKLDAFKARAEADPTNWGYAGTLRGIEASLADMLSNLS